jgi:PAS domain S-box-containing protein
LVTSSVRTFIIDRKKSFQYNRIAAAQYQPGYPGGHYRDGNQMNEKNARDEKRTSQQLIEALEYAENIVSTIREPLLVLDAGLRIISVNQSFYRDFSATPEETEGKLIYEVADGQWNIPKLRELLENILPKNTSFENYEVDHEFPNLGRRIMILNARRIHDGGKTDKILLAIEDITERKLLEKEINSSELRYRRLFETAQDGILILDADTGEINDVNPFLLKMLGYSSQELKGKRLWEIGFFKDAEASRQAYQVLREKGYVRYEDLPLQTKDGRSMQVEFVSNFYTVDGAKVIQCNIRDISERKKAEQFRDDFIGIISHELKTPLTVIIGALSTAADKRLSEEDTRELIDDAVKEAVDMSIMLDNLAELARRQSGRLVLNTKSVDIKGITGNVIMKLKGRSAIHQLVDAVPPELPPALADSLRVERIIYNLVDNAIKYSPRGGEVRVSAHREGELLEVSVADHGQGISNDDQAKLFQNFERLGETATGSIQGTGMGLRVCSILVAAHGGKIRIESEKGKGSTFFFTLHIAK